MIDKDGLKAILKGACRLAPPLAELNASIFACLTTAFYIIARLGELTVPSIKDFLQTSHIMHADVSELHIPTTKSSPITGEDIQWAEQVGLTDPKWTLENHLHINAADNRQHLSTWKHTKGLCLLLKKEFIKWLLLIFHAKNLTDLKGHSIRIGGTLEYLLQGVPFDIVKTMGRWSSKAFTLYLRDHANILAPYLQNLSSLEPFTRYTMPPVR
ncbi:hypothetical protein SERLA73DRAFT_124720 [Serpula lacrymans var. lacrymans S7.3]|uniref:Tyr recombinase domain-containing protein n=1 Tax=Serpula lacrymans var. lacrymans (strain S7.3) TaxID=936435 RepID=F8Q4C8_SERL3|nr:hypothetical protein SERLA73DRAFT_124720 [Serpula lacrymans var. lacrymans S7.3]